MAVSIGLAQKFQPQIDALQFALTAEAENGTPLTSDSQTFKDLQKFNGDLMDNTITYYRDANPFGLTQNQLLTLSTSQNQISQELVRVTRNGTASPERILSALDAVESILPPTSRPVSAPSSSTGAAPTQQPAPSSAPTTTAASSSGATVSELLDAVKGAESSNDKYALIKEAIGLMREGGGAAAAPAAETPATMAEAPAKSGGSGAAAAGKTAPASGSQSAGAPIDSAAFDKLLSALSDLADAIQGLMGLSQQAKGQIFDKIAEILKVIDGLRAAQTSNAPTATAPSGVDPALLNALNTLNEQVQTSLPEGAAKKAVQDLIADILKALMEGGLGNGVASQLNAVLAGAQGTGSEALISKVNELSTLVSSSTKSASK